MIRASIAVTMGRHVRLKFNGRQLGAVGRRFGRYHGIRADTGWKGVTWHCCMCLCGVRQLGRRVGIAVGIRLRCGFLGLPFSRLKPEFSPRRSRTKS
eukprot:2618767-Pleurochrysis_carterae.AAC.1